MPLCYGIRINQVDTEMSYPNKLRNNRTIRLWEIPPLPDSLFPVLYEGNNRLIPVQPSDVITVYFERCDCDDVLLEELTAIDVKVPADITGSIISVHGDGCIVWLSRDKETWSIFKIDLLRIPSLAAAIEKDEKEAQELKDKTDVIRSDLCEQIRAAQAIWAAVDMNLKEQRFYAHGHDVTEALEYALSNASTMNIRRLPRKYHCK